MAQKQLGGEVKGQLNFAVNAEGWGAHGSTVYSALHLYVASCCVLRTCGMHTYMPDILTPYSPCCVLRHSVSAVLCGVQASTLGNWFTGLLQRHDQLGKWLTLGRPRAYWLTGFFNPQVRSCRSLRRQAVLKRLQSSTSSLMSCNERRA
jgi:hypothetical protein